MTEFGRLLWGFMQSRPEGEINRSELAEMLTAAGFSVEPAHVSAWMNGDRMPPPGFPYYSSLVLNLDEGLRCELAWAYLHQYRDRIKGRPRSDANTQDGGAVTDENRARAELYIAEEEEEYRRLGGEERGGTENP